MVCAGSDRWPWPCSNAVHAHTYALHCTAAGRIEERMSDMSVDRNWDRHGPCLASAPIDTSTNPLDRFVSLTHCSRICALYIWLQLSTTRYNLIVIRSRGSGDHAHAHDHDHARASSITTAAAAMADRHATNTITITITIVRRLCPSSSRNSFWRRVAPSALPSSSSMRLRLQLARAPLRHSRTRVCGGDGTAHHAAHARRSMDEQPTADADADPATAAFRLRVRTRPRACACACTCAHTAQ